MIRRMLSPLFAVCLLGVLAAVALAPPAAAQAVQILPQSWGLDRIDQRSATLDGLYHYAATGQGVHLFVVDSGIRSTHVDLVGRVDTADSFTTIDDGNGTEDCSGHGTAVAGAAGGSLSGVAKGVVLHPVRVRGCTGDPAMEDVVAAIDWATDTYLAHQKGKPSERWQAVGLLSVTLPAATSRVAINQALTRSIAAGLTWIAPAGDRAIDACSPLQAVLGVPQVIVVGASDSSDQLASFSNSGSCVDLLAPGVELTMPAAAGDTAMASADGTALAAAHVAGVAALYLETSPDATPAQVERALTAWATDTPAGRLVYSYFGGDGVDEPPVPWIAATCRIQQRDCVLEGSGSVDDGAIVSYAWDFGDGEVASSKSTRTRHKYGGTDEQFTVTLTVTDDAGQARSISRVVNLGYVP